MTTDSSQPFTTPDRPTAPPGALARPPVLQTAAPGPHQAAPPRSAASGIPSELLPAAFPGHHRSPAPDTALGRPRGADFRLLPHRPAAAQRLRSSRRSLKSRRDRRGTRGRRRRCRACGTKARRRARPAGCRRRHRYPVYGRQRRLRECEGLDGSPGWRSSLPCRRRECEGSGGPGLSGTVFRFGRRCFRMFALVCLLV